MKTVRFLRSIAIRGIHCEAGTTATMPAADVVESINCGDAVEVSATEEKPAKSTKDK